MQKLPLKTLLLLCTLACSSVAWADFYKLTSGGATSNLDVQPLEGERHGYSLVSDESTLKEGDQLLIVNNTGNVWSNVMSVTQNANNRGKVDVKIENNTITSVPNNVQIITLEGQTGAWYFNVGNGYLYAASSSNNYLRTKTEKDDNAKAAITIDSSTGEASVKFQGSNTRKVMQYNSGNIIFSCYASASQKPIQLYRLNEATSIDVEIGSAGWKTVVMGKDVEVPFGVEAYIVTSAGEDAILAQISEIKKNTPVLLKAAAGVYTMPVIDDADDYPGENLLEISTETTGNGVFVLSKKSKGVGFYKWNGGLLGSGRVYLPASAVVSAREFVGFKEEITKVKTAVSREIGNVVCDLQGRRVDVRAKGMYIVNGKKVIVGANCNK